MKKIPPRKEFTVDEWYARNYPQSASVCFDVLKDGARAGRAAEFIDFSGGVKEWRHLKPKKFFDDRFRQREYLIKEIQKLFAKDKTRRVYRIQFGETGLSVADEREMWPAWHACDAE